MNPKISTAETQVRTPMLVEAKGYSLPIGLPVVLALAAVLTLMAGPLLAEPLLSGPTAATAATSATERPLSVVLVTVEGLDAWQAYEGRHLPESWLQFGQGDSASWWFGTGVLGSNVPTRALLGLLSGVPPLMVDRLGAVPPAVMQAWSVPQALDALNANSDDRAATAAWVEGFRGERTIVERLVPGVSRYHQLRPVMASLSKLTSPFFLWLGTPSPTPRRRDDLESTVERMLGILEERGLLEETLFVVTSVHSSGGSVEVPLAIRWPAAAGLSVGQATRGKGPQRASLDRVGATFRQAFELIASPAMAVPLGSSPKADEQVDVALTEIRSGRLLVGVAARSGARTVTARWKPGQMHGCFQRRQTAGCHWEHEVAEEEKAEESTKFGDRLESAILLALEKLISAGGH